MDRPIVVNIDKDKCTGCGLCQIACSYEHEGAFNPSASRICILDTDEKGCFPKICRNCDEAPCLDACPSGAITRRDGDGYIVLLSERCIGCNMCVMVCPFDAIGRGDNRNYKCDTCNHQERCARICPQGAIRFQRPNKGNPPKRRKLAGLLTRKLGGS